MRQLSVYQLVLVSVSFWAVNANMLNSEVKGELLVTGENGRDRALGLDRGPKHLHLRTESIASNSPGIFKPVNRLRSGGQPAYNPRAPRGPVREHGSRLLPTHHQRPAGPPSVPSGHLRQPEIALQRPVPQPVLTEGPIQQSVASRVAMQQPSVSQTPMQQPISRQGSAQQSNQEPIYVIKNNASEGDSNGFLKLLLDGIYTFGKGVIG